MPIPSLPIEIHREIILQSSGVPLDPLQAERGPAFSRPGCQDCSARISKALALVSWSWNTFVTPILYSHARVGSTQPGALARTLSARPSLCAFVKYLDAGEDHELLELAWPSVVLACISASGGSSNVSLGQFLLRMPLLQHLSLAGKGGAAIPPSIFAAGALRHLRILSLYDCGPNPLILEAMNALPQDQGPLSLTTLEILGSYDGDDPAPPQLLAFLHRHGPTLLHLVMDANPPHDLASICPALISLQCVNGQVENFLQHSHPTLSLIIATFDLDSETTEVTLGRLWDILSVSQDRTRFPCLLRLRLEHPAIAETVLAREELEAWDAFGRACVQSGVTFEDGDGRSWEEISRIQHDRLTTGGNHGGA